MIDLGYSPEVGDEFNDISDGGQVIVTSIDVWAGEVGFTKRFANQVSFGFEVIPIVDFQTAVSSGLFKQTDSKNSVTCWHKWETYVGFSWTWKFCNKCGIKQGDVK